MTKFIDIGANLADPMFQGIYNGSQKHQNDLDRVLVRCWKNKVDKIIVTSGCLDDIVTTVELANRDDRLHRTIGCHPTRCGEIEEMGSDKYFGLLRKYIEADINKNNNNNNNVNNKNNNNVNNKNNNNNDDDDDNVSTSAFSVKKVVAVGECGLDYERLQFCPKDIQLKYLPNHIRISHTYQLPLFLHCRAAHDDLIKVLSNHQNELLPGVVHSFDGSLEHALKFIQLGMYIGVNGCSLKTEENLEVIKNLPLDKLLLESDAPWCEIKNSHASFPHVKTHHPATKKEKWNADSLVKGRNEPFNIRQVAEVIAALKGVSMEKVVAPQLLTNTNTLFQFA